MRKLSLAYVTGYTTRVSYHGKQNKIKILETLRPVHLAMPATVLDSIGDLSG